MDKTFNINGVEVKVQDYKLNGDQVTFSLNGKNHQFALVTRNGPEMIIDKGVRFKAAVGTPNKDGESMVMSDSREAQVYTATKKMKKAGAHAGGLISPMPGKIFKILKDAGSEVKKGEPIMVLEAMKMEHSIRSDKDGKIKSVFFKVGELVQGGVVLAELE